MGVCDAADPYQSDMKIPTGIGFHNTLQEVRKCRYDGFDGTVSISSPQRYPSYPSLIISYGGDATSPSIQ